MVTDGVNDGGGNHRAGSARRTRGLDLDELHDRADALEDFFRRRMMLGFAITVFCTLVWSVWLRLEEGDQAGFSDGRRSRSPRFGLAGAPNDAERLEEPSRGERRAGDSDDGTGRDLSFSVELVNVVVVEPADPGAEVVPVADPAVPAAPAKRRTGRVYEPGNGRAKPALRISYTSDEYQILRFVKPYYPAEARLVEAEGRLIAHTLVAADGHVERILIDSPPELPAAFATSARWAVRQWIFAPVRVDGEARAFWIDVPVRFALVGDVTVEQPPRSKP